MQCVEGGAKLVRKCVDAGGQVLPQFGVEPAQRAQGVRQALTRSGVALRARAAPAEGPQVAQREQQAGAQQRAGGRAGRSGAFSPR